jgi:hypothetical protein
VTGFREGFLNCAVLKNGCVGVVKSAFSYISNFLKKASVLMSAMVVSDGFCDFLFVAVVYIPFFFYSASSSLPIICLESGQVIAGYGV